MNTRPPGQPSSKADAAAREWALQERATRDVREGADGEANDADLAAYRRIAHALRTPPAERLPSNFAFQVAQLAARLPKPSRLDLRLEQWLVRGLVGVMALAGLVVAAIYGAGWLSTLESTGTGAGGWAASVGACLLLTWALQGWRSLRN